MKNKTVKFVMAGFGLSVLASGVASYYTELAHLPMAIILFFAGIILLSQVVVRKVFDGISDLDKDAFGILSILVSLILIVSAIIIIVGSQIPAWLTPIVGLGTLVAGVLIVLQVFKK